MKEIPQRDLPAISGGEQNPHGTPLPSPSTSVDFPRNPFSPAYEEPTNFEE
jgi:hypothetical protein